MRKRGDPESWMELFGDGGAANDRPRFEHERLHASPRQHGCRREAIVTAADEDDVGHLDPPSFAASESTLARLRRRGVRRSSSSAALRPGAPMMPPPGCVADPHIYRLLMGVRYLAHPGTGRRNSNCSSASSP